MSEFSKDNLEAERRYAGSVGTSIQSQRRGSRLIAWPYLFDLGSDISPAKCIRVPNWTLFLSSDKS